MAICNKCKKEITNIYYLNGKAFGYTCYKQELAMLLAEKEKQQLEKDIIDTLATITILKNRNSNNNFINSLIEFYDTKGFLTFKQKQNIKLNKLEELEKFLIINTLDLKNNLYLELDKMIDNQTNLQDERIIHLVKNTTRKGKQIYNIIRFNDDGDITTMLISNRQLENYYNDEEVTILELI